MVGGKEFGHSRLVAFPGPVNPGLRSTDTGHESGHLLAEFHRFRVKELDKFTICTIAAIMRRLTWLEQWIPAQLNSSTGPTRGSPR